MPDNKRINRSSNDTRALGLGIFRQIYVNTTNAVILYVISLQSMTLPTSIFRYRSLTTFSIAELATSTMWIASVDSFNDPFEFQFDIEPLVESKENREFIISSIVAETGMPRRDVELEFEKYSWDDFRESFATPQKNILKEIRSQGVCCFSANKDNLLMWGHYCAGHTGFVVEYDTTKFPFQHVVPVEYDDQLCVFTIQDMIYNMSDCLKKLLVRKSTDWSYEKEVRIYKHLSEAEETIGETYSGVSLFGLPRGIIRKVIVGAQASSELQSEIQALLKHKNMTDVVLEAAELDRREYSLKISEIDA